MSKAPSQAPFSPPQSIIPASHIQKVELLVDTTEIQAGNSGHINESIEAPTPTQSLYMSYTSPIQPPRPAPQALYTRGLRVNTTEIRALGTVV